MAQFTLFGKCVGISTRTSESGYMMNTYVIDEVNGGLDWRNNQKGFVAEAGGQTIERLGIKQGSVGDFTFATTYRLWNGRYYNNVELVSFRPFTADGEAKAAAPAAAAEPAAAAPAAAPAAAKAEEKKPGDDLPF